MANARDVIDRYLAAARSGDWDTAAAIWHEDVVFHVPGSSRLAGVHHGRAAAVQFIEEARKHARDIEIEHVDTLVGDGRVALLLVERFLQDDGTAIEIRRANVYRVEGEHITEVWIYEHDQELVDRLFAT